MPPHSIVQPTTAHNIVFACAKGLLTPEGVNPSKVKCAGAVRAWHDGTKREKLKETLAKLIDCRSSVQSEMGVRITFHVRVMATWR